LNAGASCHCQPWVVSALSSWSPNERTASMMIPYDSLDMDASRFWARGFGACLRGDRQALTAAREEYVTLRLVSARIRTETSYAAYEQLVEWVLRTARAQAAPAR
jgi:hypothetical protein